MNRETYFLRVLSPLHVGAGQGFSHVDLPIVREVHTGFPYVPASSIKGVVREWYIREFSRKTGIPAKKIDDWLSEGKLPEKDEEFKEQLELLKEKYMEEFNWLKKVFGSQDSAGKVYFTDARLLLFPVKSLKGIFQLITCPYAINRYLRDLDKGKLELEVREDEALVCSMDFTVDDKIMLEEFVFLAKLDEKLKNFVESLPIDSELKKKVVCLNDSVFSDMVMSYTEVQTHIKIDPDTGTVKEGALFTTEYLPAESLLYFNLFYDEEVENFFIPNTLHLGGDITTGKGFVKVINGGQR